MQLIGRQFWSRMNISMYQFVLLSCGLALLAVSSGVYAQAPGEPEKNTEQLTAWIQCVGEMLEHFSAMKKTLESVDSLMAGKESRVGFSAGNPTSATGDVGPHPTDTVLIYKKVFTNVANVYNQDKEYRRFPDWKKYDLKDYQNQPLTMTVMHYKKDETCIFTAPERGVYFFSFFYHSRSRKSAGSGLSLFKNGDRMVATSAHLRLGNHVIASPDHVAGGDFGDNGANSLAVHLETGDTVFVGLDEEMSIWGDEHSHNTFSGFQISSY